MTMERTEVLEMMGELKLYGMKSAYDETLATALKRKHEPQQLVGDLLKAEISEKQSRSIRYQLAIAKLPLAKDVDDFAFKDTPINENLVRDLAGGAFIAQQRNVVLVGGTGTGKTHLAIAIARSCIRSGSRGRFFNTVDLVNRLEAEGRSGRQGRLADYLTRLDLIILDELGYLPFAQSGGQLLPHDQPSLRTHLDHRHHQSGLRRMAERLWRSENDHCLARPPHASLRHRRDRQRKLALQAPRLTAADPPKYARTRPGCATPTSSAGASATVSAMKSVGQLGRRSRGNFGRCLTPETFVGAIDTAYSVEIFGTATPARTGDL
jgi:DNA replication protein DnaC